MFSKPTLMIFCFAFVMLTSHAFAFIVVLDLSPEYVAMHKGELSVATDMRNGNVEFKITRSVPKDWYSDGEIVIRKGGKIAFKGTLLPTKDKSQACYAFTVSPEYLSESEFTLAEGKWGDIVLEGPSGAKETLPRQRLFAVRELRFQLGEFVKGDGK